MDHRLLQILENTTCLSKSQLLGYLSNTLQPEELYAVEMHLIECPICNDAIEGLNVTSHTERLLNTLPVMTKLPVSKGKDKKPAEAKNEPVNIAAPVADNKVRDEKNIPAENAAQPRPLAAPTAKKSHPHPGFLRQWGKPLGIVAFLALGFSLLWYFELGGNTEKQLFTDDSASISMDSDRPLAAAELPEQYPAIIPVSKDSIRPTVIPARDSVATKSYDTTLRKIATKEDPVARKEQEDNIVAPAVVARNPDLKDPDVSTEKNTPQKPDAHHAELIKEENPPPVIPESAVSRQTPVKVNAGKDALPSDFDKGMELYRQQQYGSAVLYFRAAVNKPSDPRHYDALYYSAMAYKNMGKKRKALNYFKRVATIDAASHNADARKQLDMMQ